MNNPSIKPDRGKTSFKEVAQRALTQGNWNKALENFQRHCSQEPEDLRSQLKVAELLARLGRKQEALQVYQKVADAFAQDGFLLQAISVNKMILRIDPSFKEVNDRLAKLYTEKASGTRTVRPFPHIPLFSELNEQELQLFLTHIQVKTYAKETFIYREGAPGDSLFAISYGEIGVTRKMPNGEELWVRNLRDGDIFGEFGFFTDQKRHGTVKALRESEVLEVSRDVLNEMIKTHPRVKDVLQSLFNGRVLDHFLCVSPIFSSFTSVERGEIIKRFHLRQVPEETTLFRGGDASNCLYMVKSGEVEIFTQKPLGKKIVLATLKSGNVFGEIEPLFNRPRMATAKTTWPCELLELTKEDLEACLQKFPILRSTLRETCSQRLAQMVEVLSHERVEKAKEGMM